MKLAPTIVPTPPMMSRSSAVDAYFIAIKWIESGCRIAAVFAILPRLHPPSPMLDQPPTVEHRCIWDHHKLRDPETDADATEYDHAADVQPLAAELPGKQTPLNHSYIAHFSLSCLR
ncbi:uncharacterized protein [Triticum aestivum]|uniref:uncharacterized protein n=1 Tax=Triticum aestivum TaxID=4565 RepID=UPI001D00A7A0|nr:uncharacterized protein LOC123065044 [Triticum aestivum]